MSFGHGGSGSTPGGGSPDVALLHLPFGVGDVLAGKYRVDSVLGSGGMGVVVAGTHVGLGQRVAIKVMRPTATTNRELVARFTREARATALLKSAHVARVLDVGELPGELPYMVMEFLDGSDLSDVVRRSQGRPLPIPDVVDWVLQACEGLAEAHRAGIVHRDLKPANLFLTYTTDGTPLVKVLDFGISKLATPDGEGDADELTRTQSMIGSPHYMSPEQLVSARTVDARADIWSLGAVLFRLITGEVPYMAGSTPELCVAILTWPYRGMRERRPDVPPALDQVVARCLTKDPAGRFSGVQELATALVPFGSSSASAMAERVRRIATSASGAVHVPATVPLGPSQTGRQFVPREGAPGTMAMSAALPGALPPGAPPGGPLLVPPPSQSTLTSSASALPQHASAPSGLSTGGRVFTGVAVLLAVIGLAGAGVYATRRHASRSPAARATATATTATPSSATPSATPSPSATTEPVPAAASPVDEVVDAGAGAATTTARPRPKPAVAPPAATGTATGGGLPDFGGRK